MCRAPVIPSITPITADWHGKCANRWRSTACAAGPLEPITLLYIVLVCFPLFQLVFENPQAPVKHASVLECGGKAQPRHRFRASGVFAWNGALAPNFLRPD